MQQAPHPSRGAGPATLYLIYKEYYWKGMA